MTIIVSLSAEEDALDGGVKNVCIYILLIGSGLLYRIVDHHLYDGAECYVDISNCHPL